MVKHEIQDPQSYPVWDYHSAEKGRWDLVVEAAMVADNSAIRAVAGSPESWPMACWMLSGPSASSRDATSLQAAINACHWACNEANCIRHKISYYAYYD